ncbi:MAG: hypothetical protein Q8O41_07675 [Candidatus Methanoperedens sp.]|nr:hypothetical protein [Candidatus Methanoperedens sp.]
MISNNIDRFKQLFDRVSSIIEEAKHKIAYSIDNTMVQPYWRMEKEIIEEEQSGQLRAEYLNALRAELSWTHYRLIMQNDDHIKHSSWLLNLAAYREMVR